MRSKTDRLPAMWVAGARRPPRADMRGDSRGGESRYSAPASEALAVAVGLWPLFVIVALAGALLYAAGMSANPY